MSGSGRESMRRTLWGYDGAASQNQVLEPAIGGPRLEPRECEGCTGSRSPEIGGGVEAAAKPPHAPFPVGRKL
jgi:hypothetical protein